jgi:hypothetical protein
MGLTLLLSGVLVFEQTVLMRHVMNNNLKRVIGTLMMDTIATGYFSRRHLKKSASVVNDLDASSLAEQGHTDHVHMHTQATHGHVHGAAMMIHATANEDEDSQLIRNRVVSSVSVQLSKLHVFIRYTHCFRIYLLQNTSESFNKVYQFSYKLMISMPEK